MNKPVAVLAWLLGGVTVCALGLAKRARLCERARREDLELLEQALSTLEGEGGIVLT